MVAIHPETLKTLRKRSGLSQKALADTTQGRHRVGVATIKRIEASDTPRDVRAHTAECLAHALGVAVDALSGERRDDGESERMLRFVGYRPIKGAVRAENALSYDMVEHLYGVPVDSQIAIAPLLVALMAEGSLAWRRDRLAEFDAAAQALRSIGEGHLSFSNAVYRAEDAAAYEQESIEMRDLFGRHASDDAYSLGYDPNTHNPFVDYLRAFAARVKSEDILIGTDIFNELPEYWIGASVVEKMTGNDRLAESGPFFAASDITGLAQYAMTRGHAKIKDIPEDLLGEDRKEERVAWMVSRIPGDERKALEEEERKLEALRKKLGIDLSEAAGNAPSPESC